MARIVYGVSGEGSGHSSRAREIASHLREKGHTIWLVSYDRGYQNLRDDFDVFETEGLSIASKDNKVSIVKTFTENIKRLPEGYRSLQELREKLFKEFRPDCVITDFEPMTAYLANHYSLPLVTIDNQHRMRYLKYECPPHVTVEAQVTKTIIRAMVPRPDVSLVTAFCVGETTNDRTFVFPPILRRIVLDQQPSDGDHILVYLTSGFESFLEELSHFRRESFLVYGYDRSERAGGLTFKPFSREGFLEDLASAKAVMATAGFTLISEALCLKKPCMAMPMRGQFEQELNAFQLERLGYGKSVPELSAEAIGDFLYRVPDYAERLKDYEAGDNLAIKEKLDELLENDCTLARRFHDQRA
ncbi:MAG: MJ1255/VC2487 family glycosyltransferase [Planctomycetota bacterium]